MSKTARPIFSDPNGRRARVTKFVFSVTTVVFFITVSVLFIGIVMRSKVSLPEPQLLASNLPASNSFSSAVDLLEVPPMERPLQVAAGRQIPDGASNALRIAFSSTEEQRRIASLKEHA